MHVVRCSTYGGEGSWKGTVHQQLAEDRMISNNVITTDFEYPSVDASIIIGELRNQYQGAPFWLE